jgi:hypothetical protein
MEKLNLPDYRFRIKKVSGSRLLIFDEIRQKNILLTPEEWVRQHILRFLVEEKKYPSGLISIESEVKLNRLMRRYDALIHNRQGKPVLLVECKAPSVKIKQDTFDQILAYNRSIKAAYMLVTNGLKHYCCHINPDSKKFDFLSDIPDYATIAGK